jgi:ATP-binding cassette, subfamily C (CFTR/MRP), member 1
MVITSIIEASVAVSRLTSFLAAEEIQPDAVEVKPIAEEIGEETVAIRGAAFSWNRHEDKHVLKNIDFSASKGDLTCVVGRVGSGKSSLLQSILGDLWKVKGRVEVAGSVAYVAQQAWIVNATVKENIIFGYRYDSGFYERTVKACALLDDFAQLPDGDETVVGERGISLSGGQKARLALARAVYARADIYLLDDCLSAVDSHVGRHLVENVLGPTGLLNSKTRILATNAIPVLAESDAIYMLKDGEVVEKGTYKQLVAKKGAVSELIKTAGRGDSSSSSAEASSSGSSSETSTIIEPETSQEKMEMEEAQERLAPLEAIKPGPAASKKRSSSLATLRRASTASFNGPRGKLTDEEAQSSKTRQAKEHLEQGKVKWQGNGQRFLFKITRIADNESASLLGLCESQRFVCCRHLPNYFGGRSGSKYRYVAPNQTLVILPILGEYGLNGSTGGGVWLKEWAEANGRAGGNPDVGKFIGIYFAFGIGASALTVIQTLILWIFCSIEVRISRYSERMTRG